MSLQTWRLDSDTCTYVFIAENQAMPECVYWGAALARDEDLEQLTFGTRRPLTNATLDRYAPLSLYPEEITGWQAQVGLELSDLDGKRLLTQFVLVKAEQTGQTLHFTLTEATIGLSLNIQLELRPYAVLSARSELTVTGTQAIKIEHFSAPVLPVPDTCTQLLDFAGRWCGEFQAQTRAWQSGAWLRESHEGRTGHGFSPTCFALNATSSNTQGEVRGWHLGWSGGHQALAEELQDGRRQIQFSRAQANMVLKPNETLDTPSLYCVYSAQGLNGALQSYHQLLREQLIHFPDPKRSRPVHYNCWEAIYFDHSLDGLKTLATQAAELGAERFVLDDGWFKGRHHDLAALGDWTVDSGKYPQGLHPLIEHIHQVGMRFGLWVEPEMVNPDSDLYRAHPDWVLGPKQQALGRNQLALDLQHPAVLDYLYQALSALLREYPIDYLKWDHNRVLTGASYQQTLAYYNLLTRLRQEFPQVEIESCASGGGRIDYGVLAHTHRVWLSDSNDALERWRMQHEAALILAPEITGSHVGPRTCHSSGRVLPMAFRAWVAASRHMGFEMDLRELDAAETQTLKQITAWWKANRDWLFKGRLHRLDSQEPDVIAEMTVAAQGERFVLFAGLMQPPKPNSRRILRLTGLEPTARYRLRSAQPDTLSSPINRLWRSPIQTEQGLVLSGQSLMQAGISLPLTFPAQMNVIEGERL
ncbi:MAG: alpha-galactosidase [Thiothrix sp.]|nr:MAG: alpha-galactosidase [Thiothrix sp.]